MVYIIKLCNYNKLLVRVKIYNNIKIKYNKLKYSKFK